MPLPLLISRDGCVKGEWEGESKNSTFKQRFAHARGKIDTHTQTHTHTQSHPIIMPTLSSIALQQLLAPYPRDFKNIPTATDYGKGADVEANKSEEMVSVMDRH